MVQFYNDPLVPILGSKHPAAMAQSGSACWAEIWPTLDVSRITRAVATDLVRMNRVLATVPPL